MSDLDVEALLHVAHEVVDTAVTHALTRRPAEIRTKGFRDLVTDLDLTIERRTRTQLRRHTPTFGFLGEETGSDGDPDTYWVLDPVDGTTNFVHGLPLCGIALGLVHRHEPVLGVIALPFLRSRYWAARHHGARRNGDPITVSPTSDLGEAVISLSGYGTGDEAVRNRVSLALDRELTARSQGVRRLGSAAVDLAWVADGSLDATITLRNHTWDTAAGAIIAREAGAVVVDADGAPHTTRSRCVVATTPELRDALLPLLRIAQGTPFWPTSLEPTATRAGGGDSRG